MGRTVVSGSLPRCQRRRQVHFFRECAQFRCFLDCAKNALTLAAYNWVLLEVCYVQVKLQ